MFQATRARMNRILGIFAVRSQPCPALFAACGQLLPLQLRTIYTSHTICVTATHKALLHVLQFSNFHNSSSSPTPGASTSVRTPFSDDHEFVGAYTPVTKRLWQERLRMAKQKQQEEAGVAVDAADVSKAPHITVVDYPFTTDNFLLEMASSLDRMCCCQIPTAIKG